ncbi:MAG: GPW/gp25 family protein [Methylococcaceae bacterium]|nr:GPW/gp25 family protein [Methylococcaceae bacterium]
MTKKFLGRGWKFPVEINKETRCFAEAEYEASIQQAIEIILSTAKGERVMRPDFGCGIHELVFAVNNASTIGLAKFEVEEALRHWEPRIEVLEIEATISGNNAEKLLINVVYKVRTTDNRFNFVYPFYLQRGVI